MSNLFWSSLAALAVDNEADVETRLIVPLLTALGYSLDDIGSKVGIVFRTGKQGRPHEADYIVYDGKEHNEDSSLIVCEAKSPAEDLVFSKLQAESYAFASRAPFLLLTNGVHLEIWQVQLTGSSELLLRSSIADLASQRGTIEALIGRPAATGYSRSILRKSAAVVSADLSAYIEAEARRAGSWTVATLRKLTPDHGSDIYASTDLMAKAPQGATVTGASGFGKTTLAGGLHVQAIAAYRVRARGPLPFHIDLPELAPGESVMAFLAARVGTHCPSVTESRLIDILRQDGALLVCDSFDRLPAANAESVARSLRTMIRDFSSIQLFVLTNRAAMPNLGLPALALSLLDADEQSAMAAQIAPSSPRLFESMPSMLRKICNHPLLLAQAMLFRLRESKFPTQLTDIFQSWLDDVTGPGPGQQVELIGRQDALAAIAAATAESPLTRSRALAVLDQAGIPRGILDALVARAAISVEGDRVALIHEALADFVRAKKLSSLDDESFRAQLAKMNFKPGTWLPAMLIALVGSDDARNETWKKIASSDPATYFNVLRYRPDLSARISSGSDEALSASFLQEYLDGFDEIVDAFFPRIRPELLREIIGESCEQLAVTGTAYKQPPELFLTFRKNEPLRPRIEIGVEFRSSARRYTHLGMSGYRLDSGRLLSAQLLRDSVKNLLKKRRLNGGSEWLREITGSRLRYLKEEHGLPVSDGTKLGEIESMLLPHTGKTLGGFLSSGPMFEIDELLRDLGALQGQGTYTWEAEHAPDLTSQEDIAKTLNHYYRLIQLLLRELVEQNFAAVKDSFGFYSAIPVRWAVTVVQAAPDRQPRIHASWMPVREWNDAGADVKFAKSFPKNMFSRNSHQALQEALAAFGRRNEYAVSWEETSVMPLFDGHSWTGAFDGETAVVGKACDLLAGELDHLFSELPQYDE